MSGATLRPRDTVRVKYRKIHTSDLKYDEKFFMRGTYADVRKATWQDETVAVKIFPYSDRKGGFSDELVSLSILHKHPNIVTLHGAHLGDAETDRPFLVLEFALYTLEKVLHQCRRELRYTLDHVMSWTIQMTIALEYIHSQNMLHRDIKPSNFLLFQDGSVLKLCDFGTASKLEHTLTNAVGTTWYMAPEVIRGTCYTASCDVYSFGVVLWEMITRHKPYLSGHRGRSMLPHSFLFQVASGGRPPMIARLPKCLNELIQRCWDEGSHKRPTTLEIKTKLERLVKLIQVNLGKPFIHLRRLKAEGTVKKGAGSEGVTKTSNVPTPPASQHQNQDVQKLPNEDKQDDSVAGDPALQTESHEEVEISDETKLMLKEALEHGHIRTRRGVVFLVGVTGSGKTHFLHLVLDRPIPDGASTGLVEIPARLFIQVNKKSDGEGDAQDDDTWTEVSPNEMLQKLAGSIKTGINFLSKQQLEVSLDLKPESLVVLPSDYEDSKDQPSDMTKASTLKPADKLSGDLGPKVKMESSVPMLLVQAESSPGQRMAPEFTKAMAKLTINQTLLQKISEKPATKEPVMEVDCLYISDTGGQLPFREMLPHFVHESTGLVLMQKLNERLDHKPITGFRVEGNEVIGEAQSMLSNEEMLLQYIQAVQSHRVSVFVVGSFGDEEHLCTTETRREKNDKLMKAFRGANHSLVHYQIAHPKELIFPINSKSRDEKQMKTACHFRTAVRKNCLGKINDTPVPWFVLEQLLRQLAEILGRKVIRLEECYEVADRMLYISLTARSSVMPHLNTSENSTSFSIALTSFQTSSSVTQNASYTILHNLSNAVTSFERARLRGYFKIHGGLSLWKRV